MNISWKRTLTKQLALPRRSLKLLREKLNKINMLDPVRVEQFIQEIAKKFNPSTVILHGSATKGNFVEKLSDIDITVISPKFNNVTPEDRFTHLLELAQKHALRVDALGYTPGEFIKMIKKLNFFALDVVYYGLPLHDENDLWDVICKEFNKVEKKYKLKKTETDGWTFTKPN